MKLKYKLSVLYFLVISLSFVVEANETGSIQDIIQKYEMMYDIPSGLLKSIAHVESKSSPYAVNVSRRTHYFNRKNDAKDFVQSKIDKGHKNISLGCLQIHYDSHKNNFNSVSEMLEPEKNIEYAAKLLSSLYKRSGSWEEAIKMYHASGNKNNERYCQKVMNKYSENISPTEKLNAM